MNLKKGIKKCVALTTLSLMLTGVVTEVPLQGMNVSEVHAAAKIKISASKAYLIKGKTKKLSLKNAKGKVKWTSSKKSIATVNSKGVVKAKKKGVAVITATYKNKKYKCKVIVEAPKLSNTKITLTKGQSKKIVLKGTNQKVVWSSTKSSVASVSRTGLVKAKKAGTAKIAAKVGGTKYYCTITVKNKPSVVPQPEPEPMPTPQPETEPAPVPQPQPQPETEPTPVPQPQPETEPAPVPQPQPQPQPETEPAPMPEPQPQPEPEPEPEPILKPAYSVIYLKNTKKNCILTCVSIQNHGVETMRVLSKDAMLIDADYSYYDRHLKIFDKDELQENNRLVFLDYVDILPGESKIVWFAVDGAETWYDSSTAICFKFQYGNHQYLNIGSHREGSTFYLDE